MASPSIVREVVYAPDQKKQDHQHPSSIISQSTTQFSAPINKESFRDLLHLETLRGAIVQRTLCTSTTPHRVPARSRALDVAQTLSQPC